MFAVTFIVRLRSPSASVHPQRETTIHSRMRQHPFDVAQSSILFETYQQRVSIHILYPPVPIATIVSERSRRPSAVVNDAYMRKNDRCRVTRQRRHGGDLERQPSHQFVVTKLETKSGTASPAAGAQWTSTPDRSPATPLSKSAQKKAIKAERYAAFKLERRAREKEAKKQKKRLLAEKRTLAPDDMVTLRHRPQRRNLASPPWVPGSSSISGSTTR